MCLNKHYTPHVTKSKRNKNKTNRIVDRHYRRETSPSEEHIVTVRVGGRYKRHIPLLPKQIRNEGLCLFKCLCQARSRGL